MGDADRTPEVFVGFLGWSNMRGGTEFYSVENDENGRWAQRRVGDPNEAWGDLLVDEMADAGISEGATVVVVASPRFHDLDVDGFVDRVRSLLDGEDDRG